MNRYSPFYRAGLLRRAGETESDIERCPAADISENDSEYMNGSLTIRIPKKKGAKRARIDVPIK